MNQNSKFSVRDICYAGLFAAVIAVMAQISIPMPLGVPMLRYIRAAGPCLRKRPITRICKAANRTASRDGLVLTAVCRLKRTRSTTVWLLPVLSARSLSHSSV